MHAYTRQGRPHYYIVSKNGNERATTISDCRKLGLLPSVTEVLRVIDKPALTNWQIEQAVLASLTLPRVEGEPEDSLLRRIKADSESQAKAAAGEGSRIHDAIECHFKGVSYPTKYKPHVDAARRELWRLFPGVTDWVSEQSFGHPLGFGGKVDLHSPSTGIVADFKGKDGDFSNGKKLAYDQHWQLGAYQVGLQLPRQQCANIFVSRTHPGAVASHVWTEEDINKGWRVFHCALELWKQLKGYDPSYEEAA